MANKTTEPQDSTEVLVPKVENREVTIGIEPNTVTFVQRPFSFFQKLEFFSILGKAIDDAMSGPNGLTLSELFDGPASVEGTLNSRNFKDADTFVKAIAKVVIYVPELLSDLYLVILAVPRGQREIVRTMMEWPAEEGGLSDEDGLGILETFVDQNWDVMVDFFKDQISPLFQKISEKVQESQPSKPSKNTQRTTQKA